MKMMNRYLVAFCCAALWAGTANAKVGAADAAKLGKELTVSGAETAASADGQIPAYKGGYVSAEPPKEKWRSLESFPELTKDKVLYTITAANMAQYKGKLAVGQEAMLKRFPDSYKIPVYPSKRTAAFPDFLIEANKKNATVAELTNGGEALEKAIMGIPFPIPQSALEVIWNHKLRWRGSGGRRYNTQLAVQNSGDFQPFKLQEDVRINYSVPGQTPETLNNTALYFLQLTVEPARQAGSVLLVHETMDQIKEPRRAWLYNPGQRRVRRAPNVAYDNPGNGSDGLRTNDQLDGFNGATDRYTWKLLGKREMIMPYNAILLGQNAIKYKDMVRKGHLNTDLTRYEMHRVWVVEAQLKSGTSHIYSRRTFYIDEDTWSILHTDMYDKRGELWRIQEEHSLNFPWLKRVAAVCGVVYDLQSGRYLLMNLNNEEPLFDLKIFDLDYFESSNMAKLSDR